MMAFRLFTIVLTVALLPFSTRSASAAEGIDYNSSRSNKSNAVFAPDGPPCGGPGECLDGSPFGASCTSNADCGASVCALLETNVTTTAGEDGCSPYQSYSDFTGNTQGSWKFGPKSSASLGSKVTKGDLSLKLKLKDIVEYESGVPASGTGTLALELARRVRDDIEGDIALATIVVTVPITVAGGKLARGLPSLGATETEVRVLGTRLLAPNGTAVASAIGYGFVPSR
jgi:hypothetical protein